MTDLQESAAQSGEPIPGEVLFLPDPYSWYSVPDIRKYRDQPEYAAEYATRAYPQEETP